MSNSVQKSFAIVTLAICVFLLGRFYLLLNLEYSRTYHPFLDWTTNFVSTYILALGYLVFFVNFARQRMLLIIRRDKKAEQQEHKATV